MNAKIIGKIEHVARSCRKMGLYFHADLLRTACEQSDTATVGRVALLLRLANRKQWADLLVQAIQNRDVVNA